MLSEREADRRRSLLQFLDPASSSLDEHTTVRRVIAAERLRDVLYFGPLAEISDPASGLSDLRLVGRTIFEIAELVMTNLDLVSQGSKVQRLLRPGSRDAATALVKFVRSPVTMTGNFRRLREHARETLLMPVLRSSKIDAGLASMLATRLAMSEAGEEIFAQVQRERPEDRLQPRHRQSLDRYLSQACRLINDFIQEGNYEPDERQKDLQRLLRGLRAHLKTDGPIGSVEWLEGQVGTMLDASAPVPSHPTLIGASEPVTQRKWDEEDEAWGFEQIDLPEFHFGDRPTLIEVAAGALHWRHAGRAPTRRDIVEELAKRRIVAALMVAEDDPSDDLKRFVNAAAEPPVRDLRERLSSLAEKHGSDAILGSDETKQVEAALHRLDIDEATERLDLLELNLEEAAAANALGKNDDATKSREDRLHLLLQLAGLGDAGGRCSLRDLEITWRDEMARRSQEMQHLVTVENALASLSVGLPELASAMEAFGEGNLEADRWLPENIAGDFAFLVQEPASKLASWAANAPIFRTDERMAVSALCGWFIDFVTERALTIHSLESSEDVATAMDRILEVADCINKAALPTECLTTLVEAGEASAAVTGAADMDEADLDAAAKSPASDYSAPSAVPSAPTNSDALPIDVAAAVRGERWVEAATLCRQASVGSSTDASQRLIKLADAMEGLSDESPIPDPVVADLLPSAAAWISNHPDAARLLPEARRVELAYRTLSGVIAADGNRQMPRRTGSQGSWAELLERNSPFRRQLSAGLPTRTARTLMSIVTGSSGETIAERLWDAATESSRSAHLSDSAPGLLA